MPNYWIGNRTIAVKKEKPVKRPALYDKVRDNSSNQGSAVLQDQG